MQPIRRYTAGKQKADDIRERGLTYVYKTMKVGATYSKVKISDWIVE